MMNHKFNFFRKYPENWKELSEACKKRDGYKCRRCGRKSTPENRLHACHIDPKGPDTLDNLATKCEECHSKEPGHQLMRSMKRKKKRRIIRIEGL